MTTSFRKIAAFAVVTLLYLALMAGITLSIVTSGAAGQEAGNATTTPQPIEGTVGPIKIVDYRAEDGEMILTLRTEEHTPIAVSDSLAGLRGSGITRVPVKQMALSPGTTTVRLPVTEYEGAVAVTVSTPGNAVRIQTHPINGNSPVDYSTAQGLAGGAAVVAAGGTYTWVKRRREDEQKDAERVL